MVFIVFCCFSHIILYFYMCYSLCLKKVFVEIIWDLGWRCFSAKNFEFAAVRSPGTKLHSHLRLFGTIQLWILTASSCEGCLLLFHPSGLYPEYIAYWGSHLMWRGPSIRPCTLDELWTFNSAPSHCEVIETKVQICLNCQMTLQ